MLCRLCRQSTSGLWCRNINRLPFCGAGRTPRTRRPAAPHTRSHAPVWAPLRTDSPTSQCSYGGTVLLFGRLRSHQTTCYYTQDLHYRNLHGASQRTLRRYRHAHLLVAAYVSLPQRRSIGWRLKRHPFSGQMNLAGELLHTLWRIPTSVATFLLSSLIHTF